jgi:hypothetical protein
MKNRGLSISPIVKITIICVALAFTGCAKSGWFSPEAVIGSIAGAGAGGGIAAAVGSKSSEAVLASAGAGAALGLVGGKLINEKRVDEDPEQQVHVIRRPAYSPNLSRQKEIDALGEQIHESGKWGRSETKHWNDRYEGERRDIPYDGGVGQ